MSRALHCSLRIAGISFVLVAATIPSLVLAGATFRDGKAAAEPLPPSRKPPPVFDIFAPLKGAAPPSPAKTSLPAPIVPTPTPQPQPPRLPFRFYGQWQEDDKTQTFFLARGKEILSARIGDQIDANYRLEKFDGSQLHLIYVPLNARQTIFVGNNND